MSATNVDLGNVEYVYLRDIDCNNANGGATQSSFTWNMPYINPREAPYMFIQVVQLYVDHSDGAGITQPQHLRFTTIKGSNSYSTSSDGEGPSQLASLMERDDLAGHWTGQSDAPMIQVPSNINQLSFTINRNLTGAPIILGAAGCIDILLKIVRPKPEAITQNTLASYVRTMA